MLEDGDVDYLWLKRLFNWFGIATLTLCLPETLKMLVPHRRRAFGFSICHLGIDRTRDPSMRTGLCPGHLRTPSIGRRTARRPSTLIR